MSEAGVSAELTFNSRLERTCIERNSNLCVGLDPDCRRVRAIIDHPREPDTELCLRTMFAAVTAAVPFAAAFKPNAGFFEALEDSAPLMAKVGSYLAENAAGTISVCDAKRGDIGNTSERYAQAVFERQGFDAITVNPLMGYDAVEPFLRDPQRGVFLLCLTSNPGADDFLLQDEIYLRIAEKAVQWNTNGNVGLVAGATRPEYLAQIRKVAPDLPLLVPGVGAQGGKLAEVLDAIGGGGNRRFLISSSRSVLYPPDARWANYVELVAAAAMGLRDEINGALGLR